MSHNLIDGFYWNDIEEQNNEKMTDEEKYKRSISWAGNAANGFSIYPFHADLCQAGFSKALHEKAFAAARGLTFFVCRDIPKTTSWL